MDRDKRKKADFVTISDTDEGNSSGDQKPQLHPTHAKKRKVEDEVFEKVHLTDDSDGPIKKPKKRRAKRKSVGKKRKSEARGDEQPDEKEDLLQDLPGYLQERRRAFDEERKKHHENALMIPPDYSGIAALHNVRLDHLDERPKFGESSG